VPKYAESLKNTLLKQADTVLFYIEQDLETLARKQARDAARAVDGETLLEGRPDVVRRALEAAGQPADAFDWLRLEASSPVAMRPAWPTATNDVRLLREVVGRFGEGMEGGHEDSLALTREDGSPLGVLRFQFSSAFVREALVREYFSRDFVNPNDSWIIRVADGAGRLVYESAPTPPGGRFEAQRVMASPSFRGLSLLLRYRDHSIEQEVRRLARAKTALIGFIDLMLLAGLYLVYSNVRRELRLSRLKSDFVANVSHELKTPLALIRLFAETLELGRVQGSDKARQYYRIINKESQRLTQLINNILDFSRIEAGRKQYRLRPIDLGRVVEDVLDAYRFQVEQQGFALEVEIAEDLPEVEGDPEALSQALLNLLNNAIKYSREERRILVFVRRDAESAKIGVTDRGIGVAREDRERIFEKFYRAEDSLVHETKGSGLGLSLVRHIMEAHGGSVAVESTPGAGSTFTLVIPIDKGSVTT
jgi:signal transduction histidine kinase